MIRKVILKPIWRCLAKVVPALRNPPPVGTAQYRRMAGTRPIRRNFGWDTGAQCVDRYYIERFLAAHAQDVRGRVLEVGDNSYTLQFGGDRVRRSEVLHAKAGNPAATLVGDLASGEGLPDEGFDCMILTQVLMSIFDLRATVATIYRKLLPGGVALVSVPAISQISRYDMDEWGDFWRFTPWSAARLFTEAFPEDHVTVESFGNVRVAVALLHGLVACELKPEDLDFFDRDYPVTITVRAVKPAGGQECRNNGNPQ